MENRTDKVKLLILMEIKKLEIGSMEKG